MADSRTINPVWTRGVAPIVLGIILGAILGTAVAVAQTKRYTADAQVSVAATGSQSSNSQSSRTNGVVNMDTEAQVVTSAQVTNLASQKYRRLAAYTHMQLSRDILVSVPANTTILDIAFTTDDPRTAQRGANALAQAYLDNRRQAAQQLVASQLSGPNKTQARYSADIEKLTDQISALGSAKTSLRPRLKQRLDQINYRSNALTQLITQLSNVSTDPGTVLSKAAVPTTPSSPVKRIYLASGVGIGLVIGLIFAWALLRFRRTVRQPTDVTHVVDVPCLAKLPAFGNSSALVEPYRRLALVATSAAKNARGLVVTAPLATTNQPNSCGEVATGLASALTRGGTATGLVRVGTVGSQSPPTRDMSISSYPNSDAITSPGSSLEDSLDLVQGSNDLLVFDVPGAAASANAATMATVADAVVLVVDVGTRSSDLRAAVASLDDVGAPVLGIVLTQPLSRKARAASTSKPGSANDGASGRDETRAQQHEYPIRHDSSRNGERPAQTAHPDKTAPSGGKPGNWSLSGGANPRDRKGQSGPRSR